MNRIKLFTAMITILAATSAVGLTIWNEGAEPGAPVAQPITPVSAPQTAALSGALTWAGSPALPADMAMAPPLPSMGPQLRARMAPAPDLAAPPPAPSDAMVQRNAFGVPCGITLSGRALAPALVSLTLSAPCRPDTAVTVRHGELVFTGLTDSLGTLALRIPALSDPALFDLRFADAEGESIELPVPDLAAFTRVGLQWRGDAGLQLHALEFGADYGESGHVWSGAPRGPEFAASGRGGFVMRLGQGGPEAEFAEIYTYPAGADTRDGVVRLSIEAEVTEANCGTQVSGGSLQPAVDGTITAVGLTMAIPDCDALGEFLVLKNILRDLRIAAR